MKTKQLLTAALSAMLIAAGLVLAACEVIAPEEEGVKLGTVNADGTVRLAIKTKADTRALTSAVVENSINYYEAIFKDSSSNFHRITWYKGQTPIINLPPADYAEKAILLAGTNNVTTDNTLTLLAVGHIETITGGTGTTYEVRAGTTNITFKLYKLLAAPSTVAAASSFKITGPTGGTTSDWSTANNPAVPFDVTMGVAAYKVPLFKLPKDSESGSGWTPAAKKITATYTIGTLSNISYGYTGPDKLGDYLFVNDGTGSVGDGSVGALTTIGLLSPGGDLPISLPADKTIITNTHNSNLGSGTIDMEMGTPNEDGLSVLFFDLKVTGFGYTSGGLTWHLRGGLNNNAIDVITTSTGTATDSIGGGILLLVGDLKSSGSGGIEIGSGY